MSDTKIDLLIVDDEPSTRYSLCQIFRCKGHTVRTAEDGFSALQEIRNAIPDIILCDLNMPRMSGFELLSVIRRRFPQIFVIAMSGGYMGAEIPPGIAADRFYSKGTGLATLFQLMQEGTETHAQSTFGRRRTVPVWVSPSESNTMAVTSASQGVLIGCPECLRAFPLAVGSGSHAQETDCVHCNTPFQYAVVA